MLELLWFLALLSFLLWFLQKICPFQTPQEPVPAFALLSLSQAPLEVSSDSVSISPTIPDNPKPGPEKVPIPEASQFIEIQESTDEGILSYSSSSVNESISFEHAYQSFATSTPKPSKSSPVQKYEKRLAKCQAQVRLLQLQQKKLRMKIINEKKTRQTSELSRKTKVQVCHEMLSKSGKFTTTHINNLLKTKGKQSIHVHSV